MKTPLYEKFARAIIKEAVIYGRDWDGLDIQDLAIKCHILVCMPYDPMIHGENNVDAEPGDSWYVFAEPETR